MSSLRDRMADHSKKASRNNSADFKLPDGVDVTRFEELFTGKATTIKMDFLTYVVSSENHPDNVPAGDIWYRRPFAQHFIPGRKTPVICPQSIGKPCPICIAHARESKSGNMTEEELQAIKAKDRVLLVYLDDKSDDIHILNAGDFAFGKKLAEEVSKLLDEDPSHPVAEFPNQKGGMTTKVRIDEVSFGGKGGRGGKYVAADRFDFIDRDDIPGSIMKKVPDLDEVLVILPYDELESLFVLGSGGGDDDEEDSGSSRGRSRGRSRGDDDSENEPVGRGRGRGRSRGDNDDDDGEERSSRGRSRASSSEDEEPKSRRSRGSSDDEAEEKTSSRRSRNDDEDAPTSRRGSEGRSRSGGDDDEEDSGSSRGRSRGRSRGDDDSKEEKSDKKRKASNKDNPCRFGLNYGADFMTSEDCDNCDDITGCRDAKRDAKGD